MAVNDTAKGLKDREEDVNKCGEKGKQTKSLSALLWRLRNVLTQSAGWIYMGSFSSKCLSRVASNVAMEAKLF